MKSFFQSLAGSFIHFFYCLQVLLGFGNCSAHSAATFPPCSPSACMADLHLLGAGQQVFQLADTDHCSFTDQYLDPGPPSNADTILLFDRIVPVWTSIRISHLTADPDQDTKLMDPGPATEPDLKISEVVLKSGPDPSPESGSCQA
jgi:hypothetical protein